MQYVYRYTSTSRLARPTLTDLTADRRSASRNGINVTTISNPKPSNSDSVSLMVQNIFEKKTRLHFQMQIMDRQMFKIYYVHGNPFSHPTKFLVKRIIWFKGNNQIWDHLYICHVSCRGDLSIVSVRMKGISLYNHISTLINLVLFTMTGS